MDAIDTAGPVNMLGGSGPEGRGGCGLDRRWRETSPSERLHGDEVGVAHLQVVAVYVVPKIRFDPLAGVTPSPPNVSPT